MKLFNTKINLNFIKNSAKFLILAFLIIYCIYILYFSSLKTVETFANTYDCSKCQVKPTSGNCIKIYDISYHKIDSEGTDTNFFTISYEKIDTGYVFCPWEPNCEISNMMDQNNRFGISNQELSANMYSGLNNIRCCSNTSPWYNTNTINYNNISTIINNKNDCNTINDSVNAYFNDPDLQLNSDQIDMDFTNMFANNYQDLRKQCNTNYDFSGILFKQEIDSSGHVLLDPRLRKPGLSRKTIIDNIINKQQLIDISNGAIKEQKYDAVAKQYKLAMKTDFSYNENGIFKTKDSFYGVIDKHNKELIKLKTQTMSDSEFNQRLTIIITDLVNHYELAQSNYNDSNDNFYEIFKYLPSKDTNDTRIDAPPNYSKTYILNENEFLNCFGEIESPPDLSFNFTATGDFFGSSDPNLTTLEQASSNNYGPSAELEMELRRLQNVPPGGNAPVRVINQYLNAINGFYERHISNMLGPKTHTPNNQLVFENDNLAIKTPTFFKYETDPNNTYECQPSITGNDKFKDCGPTAYYTDFKP